MRTYRVHMPPGHDRSRHAPVVIVLHGGVVNAYFTEYNTGMNATADREGFIVVYPNGTGRLPDRILTWNVGFGFAYALRNNINDVGFIRELIGRVLVEYGGDARRVYATGISNGGILSYKLASEASDLLAAVAPVAGASAGRARRGGPLVVFGPPVHPVSVVAFHGMQDQLMPYAGGQGAGVTNAIYPPVQESIDRWVAYNGCAAVPDVWTSPSGNILRQWYTGGSEGTEVALYSIRNGGHTWPGGTNLAGGGTAEIGGAQPARAFRSGPMQRRMLARVGQPTQEISANDLMWEFFQRHART